MLRLTMAFLCCSLVGCRSDVTNNTTDFKERQKQLFYEIDHKLIYQSCQELMRLYREGRLSGTTFYADDPQTKQKELPKPIHSLQPTFVRIDEMMVQITFKSDEGTQSLRCFSNEFGEAKPRERDTRGLGFRSNPYDMDNLSGTESLDYLNENYDHFEMELVPGLTYERFTAEQASPAEKVREDNEFMDKISKLMTKMLNELAVKKQRLLYQTDHRELLKACREVIGRYNEGVFSTAKINVGEERFAQDLKHIPQIILNLEPVYIWFDKNRVMVALIGGMDHAGVRAYVNDQDAVPSDDDFKLTDGLLYYDDGLREVGANYKEYLDSLKNEVVPYVDWKRKQMNLPIPVR